MRNPGDIKIEVDNKWLKYPNLINVIISPSSPNIGALLASEESEDFYCIKVFKIELNKKSNTYMVTTELITFSFTEKEQKEEFIKVLPQMSALDLLFLMGNPTHNIN